MNRELRTMKKENGTGSCDQKTKKSVALDLLMIICPLVFLFSCNNVLTPSKSGSVANLPAGMGGVSLNIAGSNAHARTIIPVEPLFVGYTLEFTNIEEPSEKKSFYLSEEETKYVSLKAGVYKLVLIAYIDYTDEEINKPAAKGEPEEPILILDGETTNCEVTLAAINDDGEGTFSWEIGLPVLDEAYMEITNQQNPAIEERYYFVGGMDQVENPGELTLPSGFYRVLFTLERDHTRPVKWSETLHVFQNMVSPFEYTFTDAHFSKKIYTITWDYNDGSEREGYNTYFYDDIDFIHTPTRTGFDFGGWFTDAGCTTEWNDTTLIDDTRLYAKWVGAPDLSLSMPLIKFEVIDNILTPQTATITNIGNDDATGITIELTGDDASKFSLNGGSGPIAISTIGTEAPANTATITVQPNGSLPAGSYYAAVKVTYNDGKTATAYLVAKVAQTVGTKKADTIVFNSLNLMPYTTSGSGWYYRELQGEWFTGEMIPGPAPLHVEFSEDFEGNYNASSMNRDYQDLIGKYSIRAIVNTGNPQVIWIALQLAIPFDSVTIVTSGISQSDGAFSTTIYGSAGSVSMRTNTNTISIKFNIDAQADCSFKEMPPGGDPSAYYPLFKQAGTDIYYWRESGQPGPGPGQWSYGDVDFLEFTPKQSGTGTIKVNILDPHGLDIEFEGDPSGPDQERIYNYAGTAFNSQEFPIYVDGISIGKATVTLTGTGTYNGFSTVNYKVDYQLETYFASRVQSYKCNDQTVNISTNTITFTSVNSGNPVNPIISGPISLDTEFTFKP